MLRDLVALITFAIFDTLTDARRRTVPPPPRPCYVYTLVTPSRTVTRTSCVWLTLEELLPREELSDYLNGRIVESNGARLYAMLEPGAVKMIPGDAPAPI